MNRRMSWTSTLEAARRQWPDISWPSEAPPGWVAVDDLHRSVERALMCCAVSVPSASKHVLERVERLLRGWMQRNNFPASLRDDAVQLSGAALVMRGADFTGAGPLDAWLTVSAVRQALSYLRSEGRALRMQSEADTSQRTWNGLVSSTPELQVLRADQLSRFKQSFEAAVATLSPRDRGLLGLRYAQSIDVDALARSYQVHRVTMSRWLAQARAQLHEELFRRLDGATHGPELRHWLDSQVDLSLSRLFAATDQDGSTTDMQPVLK